MSDKSLRRCKRYGCACRWKQPFINKMAEDLLIIECRLSPEWAYRMSILLSYVEDYDDDR